MRRTKVSAVFLSVVLGLLLVNAEWLNVYSEEEHRPTYYNKAHHNSKHVDYSRSMMKSRDAVQPKTRIKEPEFKPQEHLSFYVNILHRGSVICAGALISRRMIITSARCFLATEADKTKQFKARDLSVLPGNLFGNPYARPSSVIATFHPPPLSGTQVHDIALLALAKKLPKPDFRYIKLFNHKPKSKSKVLMSFIHPATKDITFYDTEVLSNAQCRKTYDDFGDFNTTFDPEFFCVKNSREFSCSTRVGDPLIVKDKLAGINVYGEHCDEAGNSLSADIYYGVRHSIKFIQTATDLLRGFTGTGPFNMSATTRRTSLYEETTTDAPSLT
ncbi:hypothetical protein KR222_009468 [Zaprionus bogoriensis]|nr:hypothetical protein KR222_009468 [Zaprionus bogoriensis]